MTSTALDYLSIIGAILCFIVPTWELIKNDQKRGLRRITPIGWICIGVAVYIGIVSVSSINVPGREKKEEGRVADSIRRADNKEIIKDFQESLKAYNLHYDSNSKKIVVIRDSTDYYGVPNISLTDRNDVKIKYSPRQDTLLMDITLRNVSAVDAYNFKLRLNVLQIFPDRILKKSYLQDSGSMIPAQKGFEYFPKLSMNQLPLIDTLYLDIESSYTNYYKTIKKNYSEILFWTPDASMILIPDPEGRQWVKKMLGVR